MNKKNDQIKIIGAREHNLKNIDVTIPKGTLTVITGPSGSGKSSLALDILYTEGKRRYMESLSSYARQFLGAANKPDVDRIEGLCPSIAIEQRTVGSNPRSTVGTITEIYDYLRVLFARIGIVHCPDCNVPIKAESPDTITALLTTQFKDHLITIAAPYANQRKGEFVHELLQLFHAGLYRFVIDGERYKFTAADQIHALKLQKTKKHTIDILIDSLEVTEGERPRLQEAIEKAFKHANGVCKIIAGAQEHVYSSHRMCVQCSSSIPEVEPRLFSFNSPIGACPECHGLGLIHEWPWGKNDPESWKSEYPEFFGSKHATESTCHRCYGRRLNDFALAVTVGNHNIHDISDYAIKDLLVFFKNLVLSEAAQEIGHGVITEIVSRLTFLHDVGLGYLTLNRSARTLSGGEGQRIRLATQIGSTLSGVLYILDEPSIGLHQRDNDRLIETLKKLRDQDNTVVVVEHDMDTMLQSDYLIDMGPGAGVLGGCVTAAGTPEELKKSKKSLTGAYLAGRRAIAVPATTRKPKGFITLTHARKNNLKDITVKFPLGVLCTISGVSGSGKSSLVMQELVPELERGLLRGSSSDLKGAESIKNLVVIDQKPIGRTPRSNPATYLGVFDEIRKLFASLPESNARGYKLGRFSFNMPDGRCSECKGEGTVTVEMHFLPEVVMICKVCKGKRYNAETLQITYKGKTIADVLDMTAFEAEKFFGAHKNIAKRLALLNEVGLDYLKLGQSSTTLSGGEAQRIKLVDELAKRGNDTMYVLDEPTTGLHTSDIERLLAVLNTLVDKGNSMMIIEHNLDVLKTADYIIDMGPEGGDNGGTIIAVGTPHEVAQSKVSHTGRYLKPLLK
jgi:excinuclease ABC subunit A